MFTHDVSMSISTVREGRGKPQKMTDSSKKDSMIYVLVIKHKNMSSPNHNHSNNNQCLHCLYDPCVWIANQEHIIQECHRWCIIQTAYPSNNQKRKFCYRMICRLMHGYLGRNIRMVLPRCITDGARDVFPNETTEEGELLRGYMGFREF